MASYVATLDYEVMANNMKCKDSLDCVYLYTYNAHHNYYIVMCLSFMKKYERPNRIPRTCLSTHNGQYSITEYQQWSLIMKHMHAYVVYALLCDNEII